MVDFNENIRAEYHSPDGKKILRVVTDLDTDPRRDDDNLGIIYSEEKRWRDVDVELGSTNPDECFKEIEKIAVAKVPFMIYVDGFDDEVMIKEMLVGVGNVPDGFIYTTKENVAAAGLDKSHVNEIEDLLSVELSRYNDHFCHQILAGGVLETSIDSDGNRVIKEVETRLGYYGYDAYQYLLEDFSANEWEEVDLDNAVNDKGR